MVRRHRKYPITALSVVTPRRLLASMPEQLNGLNHPGNNVVDWQNAHPSDLLRPPLSYPSFRPQPTAPPASFQHYPPCYSGYFGSHHVPYYGNSCLQGVSEAGYCHPYHPSCHTAQPLHSSSHNFNHSTRSPNSHSQSAVSPSPSEAINTAKKGIRGVFGASREEVTPQHQSAAGKQSPSTATVQGEDARDAARRPHPNRWIPPQSKLSELLSRIGFTPRVRHRVAISYRELLVDFGPFIFVVLFVLPDLMNLCFADWYRWGARDQYIEGKKK